MKRAIRSLLEIFIDSSAPGKEVNLNCDECFTLMKYFVDLALEGIFLDDIKRPLLKHIDHCPDCQEHHLQRLTEIEDQWKQLTHPE